MTALPIQELRRRFEAGFSEHALLSRHTSARVGGPADVLLIAESSQDLARMAVFLWQHELPVFILGGGSNLLVSDAGVRGVVVLNRARKVIFNPADNPPSVWAESGANFGSLARQACQHGLSGLEWAVGVPGTLGGAVVGNAGAHASDMVASLIVAEILHRNACMKLASNQDPIAELWPVERLEYTYRNSVLKSQAGQAVVLAARLHLQPSNPAEATARADAFTAYRHRTQPPGATMGSMFKNPAGDYAGRLIEAADLKGLRRGQAEISSLHANFFVNHGGATAADIYSLIETAQKMVKDKFGVSLELEVELVGEWQTERSPK